MRQVVVATFAAAALTYAFPPTASAQNPPAPPAPPAARADTARRPKTDSLPLTPTRKVEFDTHEATWLSLDVSPDGKRIVFEPLGAAFGKDPRYIWVSRHRGGFGYNLQYPLWQLAIYDRQTGRLFTQTDVYGSALRPILSPDGQWLVYATRYDAETGLRLRNLS